MICMGMGIGTVLVLLLLWVDLSMVCDIYCCDVRIFFGHKSSPLVATDRLSRWVLIIILNVRYQS